MGIYSESSGEKDSAYSDPDSGARTGDRQHEQDGEEANRLLGTVLCAARPHLVTCADSVGHGQYKRAYGSSPSYA